MKDHRMSEIIQQKKMFRAVNLKDRSWMEHCRKNCPQEMTVISFPAVYTWQSAFGLTIDGDDRFYVIHSASDDGYYYPVGDRDACRACVRSLMTDSGPLKFVYVPESELKWLESEGFEILCEPATSEYVYSSRSLALLDNGSGTNYRVKIRHFSRDNEWSVRPLAFPRDTDLLLEKAAAWDQSSDSSFPSDRLAWLSAVKDPAALGFSGIYLETRQGEWAILLGYRSTERIFDQSFIKYSPGISRNVVPVCISEMAKLTWEKYPCTNLEDDLGNPGLRNMKMLYRPLFLLDSYTAIL